MTEFHIDINHQAGNWPECQEAMRYAVKKAIGQAALAVQNLELSIVLADDAFVQNLNKTYCGKHKPTNVLSFPQDPETGSLGDIILALETITREAQEQNKSFLDHLRHLTIHGTLHLLGYDHEQDDHAEEMEALEIKILEDIGVKNPYEADHSVS